MMVEDFNISDIDIETIEVQGGIRIQVQHKDGEVYGDKDVIRPNKFQRLILRQTFSKRKKKARIDMYVLRDKIRWEKKHEQREDQG